MTDALLAVAIVWPIVAALLPLLVGLWRSEVGWSVAAVATVVELGVAAAIVRRVYADGALVHPLAGFPRQYGIELVADELSALVVALIGAVAVATLVFSRRAGPRGEAVYSGYLLLTGGLMGVALTGDMFNLFVFLEIVGIATYALIAADRSGEAAYASLKYLFLGTIGASLYLLGVGYVFVATGTLNMLELQAAVAEVGYDHTLIRASYALVFVGLALKVAQFPLHTWQPDAYHRAPDAVTVYISALVSTAAAYAFVRVTYTVFTVEFLSANPVLREVVLAVAGISIVAGSALAVVQTELKRLFAYSSVSHFGMIVAATAVADETALLGGIVHLVGHGLLKGGLFLAVGLFGLGHGARTVEDLAGLADRAPYTAGALIVLGLGLVGVPPSVGFVAKWYIAVGAVEAGAWAIAVVIFASTLLTLAYVARIAEKLYFDAPADADRRAPGPEPGAVAADGLGSNGDATGAASGSADANEVGADANEVGAGPGAPVGRVTPGMLLVLGLAAATAVALGFAGPAFADLLAPVLGRFFA